MYKAYVEPGLFTPTEHTDRGQGGTRAKHVAIGKQKKENKTKQNKKEAKERVWLTHCCTDMWTMIKGLQIRMGKRIVQNWCLGSIFSHVCPEVCKQGVYF